MNNVLITGCGSGLGRHLMQVFAEAGWQVFATSRSPLPDKLGVKVIHFDPGQPQWQWLDDLPEIHCCINNAGYGLYGKQLNMQDEAMALQFQVNALAPMSLLQRLHQQGRLSPNARIIQITSLMAYVPVPLSGSYCASKAALSMMTRALAMESDYQVCEVVAGGMGNDFGAHVQTCEGTHDVEQDRQALAFRVGRSKANRVDSRVLALKLLALAEGTRVPNRLYFGSGAHSLRWLYLLLPTSWYGKMMKKLFKLTATTNG